jgi:hypothetical protein
MRDVDMTAAAADGLPLVGTLTLPVGPGRLAHRLQNTSQEIRAAGRTDFPGGTEKPLISSTIPVKGKEA